MWTSEERIYLNSKGETCGAKDPDKQMLLVAVGGQIPLSQAESLGLIKTTVEPTRVVVDITPELQDAMDRIRAMQEDTDGVEAAPEPVEEPEAEPEAETPETVEEAPEEAKAVTPLFNKAEKPKKNK